MDKHSLVVNGKNAVRRHCDPVITLESQRLAGHQHNVGSAIPALHLVLAAADLRLAVRRLGARLPGPAGAGAEEQARRIVRPAAHVARAHDALAVRDGEVQQATHIALRARLLRDLSDKAVDPLNRLEHGFAQHRVSKAVFLLHLIVWVGAESLQAVEEEGKRPLAVGAASHALEPAVAHARHQPPLDAHLPASDAAVVHPHERSARERVAVGIGEGALGAGADVGEHQRADGLAGQALEVAAVPGGDGGSEDAGLGAQVYLVLLGSRGVLVGLVGPARRGVVAHAEAVAIVRTAVVQTQARVVALRENAVGGRGYQMGEEDWRVAAVNEKAAHDCPVCSL